MGQDLSTLINQVSLIIVFATIALIVIMVIAIMRKNSLHEKTGINQTDKMTGDEFKDLVSRIFGKTGYTVESAKDKSDLVITKRSTKKLVITKRYKRSLSIKVVQEAIAAKESNEYNEVMIVTNNYFSDQAIELAKANKVTLWDREELKTMLLKSKISKELQAKSSKELESNSKATPAIGNERIKRTNQPICFICGKAVSDEEKQHCLANQETFEGRIYCSEHQKGFEVIQNDSTNDKKDHKKYNL